MGDSLPPQDSDTKKTIRFYWRNTSLRWRSVVITAQHFFAAVWTSLTGELWSVPKIRRIFLAFGVLCVPTCIAIGFAVQAINPMTEQAHAIVWFTLAAAYAGISVVVLEDIRPPKLWARCVVVVCLEIAIIVFLHQSLGWLSDKAGETAEVSISKDAYESRMLGMYYKWARSQQNPVQVVGHELGPTTHTSKAEKPDIGLFLIYPQEFAVELVNRSSVVLDRPKWGFAIWDLDKLDAYAQPMVLPIPTAEGDFIRKHEGLGPMTALSQVASLLKPGDRLFGYVYATCPECVKTRSYWVYATFKQGGWFSEIKGGFPDISILGKDMLTIRQEPEAFLKDIPLADRIPIYDSLRNVPYFNPH